MLCVLGYPHLILAGLLKAVIAYSQCVIMVNSLLREYKQHVIRKRNRYRITSFGAICPVKDRTTTLAETTIYIKVAILSIESW